VTPAAYAFTLVLATAISMAPAPAAAEGARYAVIIQGASGEDQYATLHRGWVNSLTTILRDRFKFDAQHLTLLVEQPGPGEERATAENVRTLMARLSKQMTAQDLLFVILIGHGGGDGADAKFNLIGPDLTIAEWNALLKPAAGRVAFVDTTSSSFAFVQGLAGPNRIVITATSSYAQRYHTVFPDAFIKALTADAADADKNNRVSLLEAFTYASRLVVQHYEQAGTMATETSVMDDTGDGVGRMATATGPDGSVAGFTYLDAVEVPKVADPETQKLLLRQQELTEQVDDLRRRRTMMGAQDFDSLFEKLIIELSLVSRDVRRRMGGR
jgi:hypothetical protein